MNVLILAGGLGTRLKSVIQNLPKPMAPIRNRPFIEYLLDFWIEKGFSNFNLLTCYQADKIQDHFKGKYKRTEIHCINEPEPLGTGGALLYALDQLDFKEELIVVNGDTFFEIDFEKMYAFHKKKQSSLTLGLRKVDYNDRYSGIVLNQDGQIELFSKRVESSEHLLINAGVYVINPSLFNAKNFERGKKLSLEDDLFPELIKTQKVYGFVGEGKFIDIGIPADYERAQDFFV